MKHYCVYTYDKEGIEMIIAIFDFYEEAILYSAKYNDTKVWKSNASFVTEIENDIQAVLGNSKVYYRYPIWRFDSSSEWNVERPEATLSTSPLYFIEHGSGITEGYIVADNDKLLDKDVIDIWNRYREGKE